MVAWWWIPVAAVLGIIAFLAVYFGLVIFVMAKGDGD